MSLFATMTPEQQLALKNIQQRQLLARQQQASNKYIPNSGWTGVLAQVYKGYLANKDLDAQEQKQKGILKQIAADKKERLKALGVIAGINAPDKPKAPTGPQQQAPQQVPQQAMIGVPGVGQTPAPQMQPPVNTAPVAPGAIPQAAPQQADSPATRMIKAGFAAQNEKMIMQGMQLKAKEGQMSSSVGKLYMDMETLRRQGKLTPQREAAFMKAIQQKGKAGVNVTVGGRPKLKPGQVWKIDANGQGYVADAPGANKYTREAAATSQGVQQARKTLHQAINGGVIVNPKNGKKINLPGILNPDGSVNEKIVAGMTGNVPGTMGRIHRNRIKDALQAKLRAETGAAAPDSEVKNLMQRFMPTSFDTDAEVIDKLNRLKNFTSGFLARTDPQLYRALKTRALKAKGKTKAEIDAIIKSDLEQGGMPGVGTGSNKFNSSLDKIDAQKKALLKVDTSKMDDKQKLKYLNQLKKLNNQ